MATKESKGLMKTSGSGALSPFEVMERRLAEMERTFEEMLRRPFSLLTSRWPGMALPRAGEISPSVDVFEDGDDVVVKAELPGMKKEDLSVHFHDGTVIISGEKKQEEKVDQKSYHMIERSYGAFTRSLHLPAEVRADKAKASFKDGILEIRVPKTEQAKKKERKIPIE